MSVVFGDIATTFGESGLWPPVAAFKTLILYPKERAYSRWRWRDRFHGFPIPIHCLIYLPCHRGDFFEFTFPRARWIRISEFRRRESRWMIHRYAYGRLNRSAMIEEAVAHEREPYDVGDLLNMDRARDLGWTRFTDRAKQWNLCSSGAGLILRAGGARLWSDLDEVVLEPHQLDPAYFTAHALTVFRVRDTLGILGRGLK